MSSGNNYTFSNGYVFKTQTFSQVTRIGTDTTNHGYTELCKYKLIGTESWLHICDHSVKKVMHICIWIRLIDGIVCKTLQRRHNEHHIVSNRRSDDCLLNRLFRRRSKKTSKLRVTGLCAGNSPVTGQRWIPAQRASNAVMFPFDEVIMKCLNSCLAVYISLTIQITMNSSIHTQSKHESR